MVGKFIFSLFLALGFLITEVQASTQIEQARAEYTGSFERYRQAYNLFQINKSQFETIPTFAHEEALVRAAKTMLVTRATVWRAYFNALTIDVADVGGIDAGVQTDLQNQLHVRQQQLTDHESQISQVATRSGLLQLAREINGKQADYGVTAYVTLGQIRKARLFYALSEALVFANGLEQRIKVQVRDPQLQAAKLRGLTEVQTSLAQAITSVGGETIKLEDYTVAYKPDKRYEKTVGNLQPLYEQLVHDFSLLDELAKGIEW